METELIGWVMAITFFVLWLDERKYSRELERMMTARIDASEGSLDEGVDE